MYQALTEGRRQCRAAIHAESFTLLPLVGGWPHSCSNVTNVNEEEEADRHKLLQMET